jgi:nucleotide-binding universal stress UspA family protein
VLAGDLRNCAPVAETGARLRVLVARGSADAHLVTMAEQENFDLVVVGQRRRSHPEHLWYGSVARGVLRSSPVSVASIPAIAAPHRPPFRAPSTVLVATDFSEASNGAVAQAAGMVVAGGTVHLAHVVAAGAASPDEARKVREQAWNSLSRLAGAGEEDRAARFERHVLEGAPTFELLALAERVGADLIVLGARSRSVGTRASLGSIARSVSERAKVPVLLVPSLSGP